MRPRALCLTHARWQEAGMPRLDDRGVLISGAGSGPGWAGGAHPIVGATLTWQELMKRCAG